MYFRIWKNKELMHDNIEAEKAKELFESITKTEIKQECIDKHNVITSVRGIGTQYHLEKIK